MAILEWLLYVFIRFSLWLRYKITVKGKDHLKQTQLPKSGGILFLANHPAEIDPLILTSLLWYPFKPHPVAIDYLFRKPLIKNLLNFIGALSLPNFDNSSNSYKRKLMEKTYGQIYHLLDAKENLLIYPAGGLKNGPEEIIGGASGVHTILNNSPNANVVLIRSKGLWGSSFSRAPTGKTPALLETFVNGFKVLLKNFIFFAPRREVLIEIEPAPENFPWKGGRREINQYLENWFNEGGPEPLNLVSFSRFGKKFPTFREKTVQEEVSLESVPEPIKKEIIDEIAKLSRVSTHEITPQSHLAQDLGLDSLDVAQLSVILKDNFGISSVHSSDLTTVGSVLAYAANLKTSKNEEEAKPNSGSSWKEEKNRPLAFYPDGKTIPELFFKTATRLSSYIACVDQIAGEVSYKRLITGVLLLSKAIAKLPGERIGIMLPASVGVNALIMATIAAGKIPVMINWTLGERNLKSVLTQSGVENTLSSWQFIDRLDNVELDGLDDTIVLLEDVRARFSIVDKLKALWHSRKSASDLLKFLKLDKISENDTAVILFTSGTESFPKGVPLSHKNIITNQRGAYSLANLLTTDVLLGALPPFHSFGFSVTGLLPLLTGLKVAYSPNPTDGKRMAEAISRWKVTLLCLAPTFLKNILRVATPEQLESLRLVVTGAEKAAAELFEKLKSLNPKSQLIEGYGITECAPILTINPPEKPLKGVGVALPDVEIKVVHPETLTPVSVNEQGLVLARGPNVFKGYLDTNLGSPFVEVEQKSWYQTGDLGFLDENNYLSLTGRLKRFIKIGGEMVSLTSIEETLQQMGPAKGWKFDPELPSLAVCPLEIEGKKSEIHLFTTFETDTEEVNSILRESGMSNIIKIRTVKKTPFIPLLGTGKIDYRRLALKLERGN